MALLALAKGFFETASRKLPCPRSAPFSLLALLPTAVHAVDFTSSNLPIVVIDTRGQTIPDEPKIDAWMGLIDNGPGRRNSLGDPFDGSEGPIAIETRGASTQGFPKKSYSLETRQPDGENRNVSLLGLPVENDWILYGPYSDKSLLRNALVYWMAAQMGAYASRSRFCELVVNRDYRGVYVLLEKIKRDRNRVAIARLDPDELAGDDLTGGYIIRVDRYVEGVDRGWYSSYAFRENRLFYQFYYPSADDIKPEQEAYIRTYIDSLETALAHSRGDYDRFIDAASFADYLIVNEVVKNVDAYRLSLFMHKDKDRDRDSAGGKLTMGPVWDFNLALGNVNYNVHPSLELQRPTTHRLQIANAATWFSVPFWFWWRRLLQDEAFLDTLKERWHTHRRGALRGDRLTAHVDSLARSLQEAQARNFERWPVLGQYILPNDFIGQTYPEEVAYLKRWLDERLSYLDDYFMAEARRVADVAADDLLLLKEPDTAVAPSPLGHPALLALSASFPNPFNGSAAIRFTLPGAVDMDLSIYSMAGQRVATLASGFHPGGTHTVRWHGRDDEGGEVASGVYLYQLRMGSLSVARKLALVR